MCRKKAEELAKNTPNGDVAAAYGQGAECHIKAAQALAQGKTQEATYWNHAGLIYNNQAEELAKNTPNNAAAAVYKKGAQYYAQAANAEAQGKREEAMQWNNAGVMCYKQAKELVKNPPNGDAVAAYGQGAEYYEQAAKAWARAPKTLEARYWDIATWMCTNQAEELAKDTPNKAAAAAYGQAAKYYAQAANAEAQGKREEAKFLNNAGWMCRKKAEELAKNPPNEKVAAAYGKAAQYWNSAGVMFRKKAEELAKNRPNKAAAAAYRQGAQYFVQAAEAETQGKTQVATYWHFAGDVCYNQAHELAKNPPNKAAAAAYGQGAAECYKKAAEAQALENPQDARYWEQAGVMFNKKADELAEAEPNANSPINQYDEYIRYYTEKVNNLITQLEENKKINQSIREHRRRGI